MTADCRPIPSLSLVKMIAKPGVDKSELVALRACPTAAQTHVR